MASTGDRAVTDAQGAGLEPEASCAQKKRVKLFISVAGKPQDLLVELDAPLTLSPMVWRASTIIIGNLHGIVRPSGVTVYTVRVILEQQKALSKNDGSSPDARINIIGRYGKDIDRIMAENQAISEAWMLKRKEEAYKRGV